MTHRILLLNVAFVTLVSASTLSAQNGPAAAGITPREIDAHLRFLASDMLEGRAPATRGGRIAEEYIASQLEAFGLQPGVGDSSYFQRVPIDVVKADPKTILGFVEETKDGRRNQYRVRVDLPLPDPSTTGRTIGEVLELLAGTESSDRDLRSASRRSGRPLLEAEPTS